MTKKYYKTNDMLKDRFGVAIDANDGHDARDENLPSAAANKDNQEVRETETLFNCYEIEELHSMQMEENDDADNYLRFSLVGKVITLGL